MNKKCLNVQNFARSLQDKISLALARVVLPSSAKLRKITAITPLKIIQGLSNGKPTCNSV